MSKSRINFPFSNRFATLNFPIVKWIYSYNKEDFFNDFTAGVVVFILLVRTEMSYAILLAGMPPIYILYTSIFPPFVYALLATTSRQLSMSPNIIIPLLLYEYLVTKAYPSGF